MYVKLYYDKGCFVMMGNLHLYYNIHHLVLTVYAESQTPLARCAPAVVCSHMYVLSYDCSRFGKSRVVTNSPALFLR